ncbi:helix-turn-helix domain-containing protein, partial [Thioclava sp. BHET1]
MDWHPEGESAGGWPAWLPQGLRLYLDHTEAGVSLRALARREGCHA